jgi:chromate transporter
VFFGLKPAVMAVVLEALLRIGRRALGGRARALLAAAAFVAIFFFKVPFPIIVLAAAILGYLASRRAGPAAKAEPERRQRTIGRPSAGSTVRTVALWLALWFVPVAVLVAVFGSGSVFVQEALFFSRTAVVTFGGAYAVLAYIAQQAVEVYGWLAPGEMLDGLGMAETTPGPLIQVVQFVGFMGAYRHPGGLDPLLAGLAGSVVTTWATFAPCFLWIFAGAPYIEYLRGRRSLTAALSGITAAVVGVVLNLALVFGTAVVWPNGIAGGTSWFAIALALGAFALLSRHVDVLWVVLGGGALGWLRMATWGAA